MPDCHPNLGIAKPHTLRRKRGPFPRISTSVPAMIMIDSARVTGIISDVSPQGLRVLVSRSVAGILHPGRRPMTKKDAPVFDVSTKLPVTDGVANITARCRATYFKMVKKDLVAVGLVFTQFGRGSSSALWQFIDESMVPAV